MSDARQGQVFLERRPYRQRRLRDAVRLLPLVGLLAWLLPLLWQADPEARPGTAAALIYVFAVWCALIVLSFALSRRVRHEDDPAPRGGTPPV